MLCVCLSRLFSEWQPISWTSLGILYDAVTLGSLILLPFGLSPCMFGNSDTVSVYCGALHWLVQHYLGIHWSLSRFGLSTYSPDPPQNSNTSSPGMTVKQWRFVATFATTIPHFLLHRPAYPSVLTLTHADMAHGFQGKLSVVAYY